MSFQTSKKNGKRKQKQRYRCQDCGYVFENKRRPKTKISTNLFSEYIHENQTYQALAKKYKLSQRTIQKHIDNVQICHNLPLPGDTVLIMDTSYFGRSFGVMVFRDHYLKRNLYWKYLVYETIDAYRQGVRYLQSQGWNIKGIVCDGRRGIFTAFEPIPIQMCQYHQIAIITRYITRKPKLEAGIELKTIVAALTYSNSASFNEMLNNWQTKWKGFLSERVRNPESGKWHYVHKRTRSAYRSLKSNLPYLFTYQQYPDLNLPNTTNSLEGIFANLKIKLANHRGLKSHRKIKCINEIFAK